MKNKKTNLVTQFKPYFVFGIVILVWILISFIITPSVKNRNTVSVIGVIENAKEATHSSYDYHAKGKKYYTKKSIDVQSFDIVYEIDDKQYRKEYLDEDVKKPFKNGDKVQIRVDKNDYSKVISFQK